MKTKSPLFGMRMLTSILALVTASLTQGFGQTNPTAQTLPLSQNFGTASFATLPAGFAAWTPGSQKTSQASAEASTASGNFAVSARTTTTTAVGVYGYLTTSPSNARVYIQTGTGNDGTTQLAAAINTGINTTLVISYQVERIQAGTANRTAGVSLQYRAGTTGGWTSANSSVASVTGTQTLTTVVAGLTASTDYQFRWVTFTGGNNGNYVGIGIDNISIQAPTTRTWIGGSTGSWNTTTNWSGGVVPATHETVVFNSTVNVAVNTDPNTLSGFIVNSPASVTLTSSNAQRGVDLEGSLTIASGATLSLTGSSTTRSMDIDYVSTGTPSSIAGTLNINSTGGGSSYDASGSITTVTGTINNFDDAVTGSGTPYIFNAGSIYNHAVDGGTIPSATWNTGSTCTITGNSGTVPTGLPAAGFANFIWNSTGMSATDNPSLAGGLKVNGDFTMMSTGTNGSIHFLNGGSGVTMTIGGNFIQTGGNIVALGTGSSGTSLTVSVGGDFSLSGGTLNLNANSSGSANASVLNVAGDFSHTGGTITQSTAQNASTSTIVFNGGTTQTYTSGGTVTNAVSFTVNSGTTLQMGTAASPSFITGAGKFSMLNGSTLGVTSADGISATSTTLGNIRNSGTRSYVVTAGSTSFIYNGGAAQQTGDGLPATVNIFNISNASGVTLTNNLTVNGALTLINGKIDASNKNISLASAAAVNGSGGSSSSYVIVGDGVSTLGTLSRASLSTTGSGSVFPIGTSNYYLPVIVKPASSPQSFSTYVFQGASMNGVAGGTPIANKKDIVDAVWNVTRTVGTGNADLTIQWDDALEGSSFANYDDHNIGISHFTGGTWLAGAQTTANAAGNTVTNTFNSFSPFGVGTISIPLPVILVDFNAVMEKNKTVDLSWSTQMEVNFSHFDVERSADGASWQSIGSVQAKGNASYVTNYAFNDASPLATTGYYRLKMVDLDGKYGYTEIKVIRASLVTDISIFPNPAKDFINVSVGGSASELTVKLVNISGQVLMEKKINSITASTISLPVHNYPQGSYFVQVAGADGSQQVNKVVITR